jgi:hypothetical protein
VSSEESLGSSEADVGYGRPPHGSRFSKGRSGNPKGRPRGRHSEIPYDTLLGQMVTIREDGRERRVTAAEAFILQLTRKGLQGDSASARASLAAIETARAVARPLESITKITRIVFMWGGVGTLLQELGLGIKQFPLDQKRVRWWLQPWIVQMALARLGAKRLTIDEQRSVWSVTRTPAKVEWPAWWEHFG